MCGDITVLGWMRDDISNAVMCGDIAVLVVDLR